MKDGSSKLVITKGDGTEVVFQDNKYAETLGIIPTLIEYAEVVYTDDGKEYYIYNEGLTFLLDTLTSGQDVHKNRLIKLGIIKLDEKIPTRFRIITEPEEEVLKLSLRDIAQELLSLISETQQEKVGDLPEVKYTYELHNLIKKAGYINHQEIIKLLLLEGHAVIRGFLRVSEGRLVPDCYWLVENIEAGAIIEKYLSEKEVANG